MLGLVRQHRRPRDIADGVDARHIGLAIAIDDDGAAIGFHAELFEPEIFDIADHADGRDHAIDGDAICVPPLPSSIVAVTLSAFLSSFVTLAPVMILMPCFSNCLRAKRGDLRVLDRQDLRQHLDDRHLGAQVR